MDEENDLPELPEFESDPLGTPLPSQASEMEAELDMSNSGMDLQMPDNGELAAAHSLAMDNLQQATEEDLSVLDEPQAPSFPEMEDQQESPVFGESPLAAPPQINLAAPIAKEQRPKTIVPQDQGALARKHRRSMNRMQADVAEQDQFVTNANAAGMDDQDFEANTFPAQRTDNNNTGQRWNEYHEANNQFRESVVDNLAIETELLIQQQHRINLLTDRLIRVRS